MVFIQQDVDQIVARAKEFGAGPGLTYKMGQFSLGNFADRGSFDLAMCLVNGWDVETDLIHAFRATVQILRPGDDTFEAREFDCILRKAEYLSTSNEEAPLVQRGHSPAELCRSLVHRFLADKYNLIYALQALIEHCATAGNHPALGRRAYRPKLEDSLFPVVTAAASLWNPHSFLGGFGDGFLSVPQTPEPPPKFDGAWYQARAQERRDQRAARQQENQRRTAAGKERAKIRV